MLGPMPIDFILFGLTLLGVALFHRHTLAVALTGLAAILAYKFAVTGFRDGPGLAGFGAHIAHEWVILANLLLLLLGFALLSRHFEESHVPMQLPRILPDDWKGGFALLWIVFVLSSFLDNIAAAIIGGTMANAVFRGKVHIGYLAAIVAASNAGGSGSVVGDTTTTMMWIDGVNPLHVLDAYIAAVVATFFFAYFAARQQHAFAPIMKDMPRGAAVDWVRVWIVAAILVSAIAANVVRLVAKELRSIRADPIMLFLVIYAFSLAVVGSSALSEEIERLLGRSQHTCDQEQEQSNESSDGKQKKSTLSSTSVHQEAANHGPCPACEGETRLSERTD